MLHHAGRWLLALLLIATAAAGAAAPIDQTVPQARDIFPEATRFGEVEGDPPAAPVYAGDELIGYLFETNAVVRIPAYSGKPVNVLVGLDMKGVIRDAVVIEHHEPILLVGIPEQRLFDFAHQYAGKSASDRVRVGSGEQPGFDNVDAISGATVTVIVVNQGIMRSARKVAVSRGLVADEAQKARPATLKQDVFAPADWATLTDNSALRRLHLTRGEVDRAFVGTEAEGVDDAPPGAADDTFIDLYFGYLNAPTIGRNLLGDEQYAWLMGELGEGDHAIAVLANGRYSFKGSGYVRGGIFDRIQLLQDGLLVSFRDLDHYRLSDVYAAGMPAFQEMSIFIIRAGHEFDLGQPWQLELLVRRQVGALKGTFASFTGDYALPDAYVDRPPPEANASLPADDEPIWVNVWRERRFQIVVLAVGLTALTLILMLQDLLTRLPRTLFWIRNGFLLYTLFFIGWYMLAQLSIVNVFTFTNALFQGFQWDTFLIDPMMFILWSFVAATLLLWGRGVYCGWLCPFGALQELVNEIARHLRVPQWHFPFAVHERLWAVKYLILLGLFAVSLQSIATAERLAEVEPFKTAIMLKFQREWGYVLYAGGLVLVSAFNRKFFCRYLCPLGAALAIPARLRLFDWLKRRKECGTQCQVCAVECEVQAIHPTGEINANECHYCLDCQVTYWNSEKCPPLAELRKRRERAARLSAKVARLKAAQPSSAELKNQGADEAPSQDAAK